MKDAHFKIGGKVLKMLQKGGVVSLRSFETLFA